MDKRVTKERAYVLHTRPYRETSLLVDVITESHGRVSLVAKSARGPKSRFRGQLSLLTPLLLSWTGLSDLKTLTAADVVGLPYRLQGDSLWACFYAHELVLRLLARGDICTNLFSAYESFVQTLHAKACYSSLRYFELALLSELGYALTLNQTADHAEAISPEEHYRYVLDHGLVAVDASESDGTVFLGADLLALHECRLVTISELGSAKRLLRYVLSHRLGPKPLKTSQLWLQMKASLDAE